ncbi:putative protein phosphatase 2C-like protein 44 [Malania oleifera]|uniref:putative protein phosphatase 2C-like protein 44 n=1 Tax=Malania oleifera TaxID=397392 RepID=UPI0025AE8BD7|nr:putative protein phosphatase 2C-like protein 44 [Malania oleifera]
MGLMGRHLKLKLRRFLLGEGRANKKQPSWMMPVSHGYHVVEDPFRNGSDEAGSDSVVVQREQVEELELWFFGVFDARIGDGITKYMQSNFFDRKLKESQIRRKSKETMRRAHLGAKAKIRETEDEREEEEEEEARKVGSASVMVINGEKLVMASMGDYRAVVCKYGVAHEISKWRQQTARRHWYRRFIPGAIRMPKVRILSRDPTMRTSKSSELVVGAEEVDSETEFIILASPGIWEVMKNQEAVNLIRHLEDPQEAAECLAREALTRMSRGNISCLVVRFD